MSTKKINILLITLVLTLKRKEKCYIVSKNRPTASNNDYFSTHCHQIQLKIYFIVQVHTHRMFLNHITIYKSNVEFH